jgi:hypothetical protein
MTSWQSTLSAILGILGQVGLVLLAIVVVAVLVGCGIAAYAYWLFLRGVEEEAATREANHRRVRPPQGAVVPAKPTYIVGTVDLVSAECDSFPPHYIPDGPVVGRTS